MMRIWYTTLSWYDVNLIYSIILIWCEPDLLYCLCLNLSWLRKNLCWSGRWSNAGSIRSINPLFLLSWCDLVEESIGSSLRFFGVLLWGARNYKYFRFTSCENLGSMYWSWVVDLLLLILPSWCGAGWSVVNRWSLWVDRGRHAWSQ
jgi:hypothetical protein